jgi:hypothetical protein
LVDQGCFDDPIRLATCIDMEENVKLVTNVTSSSSLGDSTNKEKDGNYDEDEDEEMILVSYISTVFELFNSGLF